MKFPIFPMLRIRVLKLGCLRWPAIIRGNECLPDFRVSDINMGVRVSRLWGKHRPSRFVIRCQRQPAQASHSKLGDSV